MCLSNNLCIIYVSKNLNLNNFFRNLQKMGLQNALVNSLLNPKRSIRILIRTLVLILRAMCNLTNYNARHGNSRIPQPRYYNSLADIDLGRTFFSILWVNDLSSRLHQDERFKEKMSKFDYDSVVKAYFPTKNTALQSVNINLTWKYHYFNKQNTQKPRQLKEKVIYPQSDILFGDMMTNTQGIYKMKKVKKGTQHEQKVQLFFSSLLDQNKDKIKISQNGKIIVDYSGKINNGKGNIIESLINLGKLYYLDYPDLRSNQLNKTENRYKNKLTSTSGNNYDTFLEIPYAIFAPVQFSQQESQKIICLGAIFNETFQKKTKQQISFAQLYHPFSMDPFERDRFQMAKCHMACIDTNDFTVRVHLGMLHYASSIYTTAFCNLAREKNELSWLKTQFIDVFSSGLLQIDFMANLTLIDESDPLAEKIFYLRKKQSIDIINKQNSKFNIMQFDPLHLSEDGYESDAVKISKLYYKKLEKYIDYLFWAHKDSLQNNIQQYNRFIYEQLGEQNDRFDGLPIEITEDPTTASLQKLMTNLAYLWVVHHGQTFSLVSVSNSFYLVPPMMRKPLSQLKSSYPLNQKDKQEWLPPSDVIKDSMTLHKVVTYRDDKDSLVSAWEQINVSNDLWKQYHFRKNNIKNMENARDIQICSVEQTQHRMIPLNNKKEQVIEQNQFGQTNDRFEKFQDFWNDLTLKVYEMNYMRTKEGLYNLHWLLPHELAISLNI